MRFAIRGFCRLFGAAIPILGGLASGQVRCQNSDGNPPLLGGLSSPDPINMTILTVGSAAMGPGWIRASANLIAGGEDHFRVWNLEGPWSTTRGRQLRAVAELVFAPSFETMPVTALAQISAGQALDFWTVTDPMVVQKIPQSLLELVRDDRGIPTAKNDDQEVMAYWEMALVASRTDPEAFRRAADISLTRADLLNQPSRNRGKVVTLKGRLVRLRKIEPTAMGAQAGVPRLYEGWIINEAYGANPSVVLVSSLPEGIAPAESMDIDVEVNGFFYKRYRYESAGPGPDGTSFRKAPLVMGRDIRRIPTVPVVDSSEKKAMSALLPWFLALVAGTGGLIAFLTFWMGRRDEKVRKTIKQLRAESIDRFLESGHDWPEPPLVLTSEENEQRQKRWTTPSEN
jgi:hypothetical protein